MGESNGIIGKGTILAYQTAPAAGETPATYEDLVEIVDCTDPDISVDEVEFTHYGSVDGYKEFKPSWADAGEVNVQANYLPEQETLLLSKIGTIETWRITKPDGATWTFSGFIKKKGGTNENQGKCGCTMTIRVTSKPAFAEPPEVTPS